MKQILYGFLCEYDKALDFEDNVWVEINGVIVLGEYFGPLPMIKVNEIKKVTTPNEVFVKMPK